MERNQLDRSVRNQTGGIKMNKLDYMIQLSYVKGTGNRAVMGKYDISYLKSLSLKQIKALYNEECER